MSVTSATSSPCDCFSEFDAQFAALKSSPPSVDTEEGHSQYLDLHSRLKSVLKKIRYQTSQAKRSPLLDSSTLIELKQRKTEYQRRSCELKLFHREMKIRMFPQDEQQELSMLILQAFNTRETRSPDLVEDLDVHLGVPLKLKIHPKSRNPSCNNKLLSSKALLTQSMALLKSLKELKLNGPHILKPLKIRSRKLTEALWIHEQLTSLHFKFVKLSPDIEKFFFKNIIPKLTSIHFEDTIFSPANIHLFLESLQNSNHLEVLILKIELISLQKRHMDYDDINKFAELFKKTKTLKVFEIKNISPSDENVRQIALALKTNQTITHFSLFFDWYCCMNPEARNAFVRNAGALFSDVLENNTSLKSLHLSINATSFDRTTYPQLLSALKKHNTLLSLTVEECKQRDVSAWRTIIDDTDESLNECTSLRELHLPAPLSEKGEKLLKKNRHNAFMNRLTLLQVTLDHLFPKQMEPPREESSAVDLN